MKRVLVLLAAVAVMSASSFDLNTMCRGILFATLPHPDDQNLFIGCIQGKGTVLGCNENEVFDQETVECVKNVFTPPPSYEELCKRETFGWFEYKENCELYVVCQFGKANIRQCPANNIFSVVLPGCVPGNNETCIFDHDTTIGAPTDPPTEPTILPTEPATESTTLTSEPSTITSTYPTVPTSYTTTPTTTRNPNDINISFVCPTSGFGLIPHATNCSRYFECIQGIRNQRDCIGNQIFDVITSRCGDPETSLCANNIRCL